MAPPLPMQRLHHPSAPARHPTWHTLAKARARPLKSMMPMLATPRLEAGPSRSSVLLVLLTTWQDSRTSASGYCAEGCGTGCWAPNDWRCGLFKGSPGTTPKGPACCLTRFM